MRKLIALAISLVMVLSLTACGKGGDSELVGKYLLSSMELAGDMMAYADLEMMGMTEGTYIDFKEDGTVEMGLAGDGAGEAKVDFENGTITDPGGVETTFTIDGDNIIVSAGEDMGSLIYTLESSDTWEDIKADPGMMGDLLGDLDMDMGGDAPTAPDTKGEFVSPTTELELDTYWYGTMIISDYQGSRDLDGSYDIWGYMGNGGGQQPFFEFYDNIAWEGDAILSYFIQDFSADGFYPVIDEGAWVFNKFLEPEDALQFAPVFYNGAISLSYSYDYDGESFYMEVFMREDGTQWDEANDPLPPGYDDYLEFLAELDGAELGTDATDDTEEQTGDHGVLPTLTMVELREIYDTLSGDLSGLVVERSSLTYEIVVANYFGGVEGERNDDGTSDEFMRYWWESVESEASGISIGFKLEDGKWEMGNMSINNIP